MNVPQVYLALVGFRGACGTFCTEELHLLHPDVTTLGFPNLDQLYEGLFYSRMYLGGE